MQTWSDTHTYAHTQYDKVAIPLQKAIEEHVKSKKQKGTLIDKVT